MKPIGNAASSNRRRVQDGTATPIPVMMAAAPCNITDSCASYGAYPPGSGGDTAQVSLTVAPSPSGVPSPTWTVTGSAPLDSQTPAPIATGDYPLESTKTSGSDSITGSVTVAGTTLTQSTPVYIYPSVALGCDNAYLTPALSFSGGVATALTSASGADLYVDGPYCSGAFQNLAEAGTTLHVPYGGTLVSANDYAFIDIPASAWTNAFTTSLLDQVPPTSAPQSWFLILATASGHDVKTDFTRGGSGDAPTSPSSAFFSWEQSAASIDGEF